MAAGKTTLGKPLARALGRDFVDIDEAVERAAGKTTARIFAEDGEACFRRLESEALRKAAAGGAVVACGGGTPCQGDNMDFMLSTGLVVNLEASPDVILRRLRLAPGQRPLVDALLSDPAALARKVEEMRSARAPYYGRAHATFCSDRLESREEIDESVAAFVRQFENEIDIP